MSDSKSLNEWIHEADMLEASLIHTQCQAATLVLRDDAQLALAMNELWEGSTDSQAKWLFTKLFRREMRPIDLIIDGRSEEVRRIVNGILNGTCA